jgi:hypothetical protein
MVYYRGRQRTAANLSRRKKIMEKIRKITITIDTTNAAFQDGNRDQEIARMLRLIANSFDDQGDSTNRLRDINGNHAGIIEWFPTRGKKMTIRN